MQPADVGGMKTVDIFHRVDCIDHFPGVDLLRKRKLYEDPIDFRIAFQAADFREQIGFGGRLRKNLLRAAESELLGFLRFAADVDFGGGIISDAHCDETGSKTESGD